MSSPAFRLSLDAQTDLIDILRYTQAKFGENARRRYQGLIQAAFVSVAAEPERIGSLDRKQLAAGLRSLHLLYCRTESQSGRVDRPRHVVFYRLGNDQVVEIVRILHDAMEVERHLQQVPAS
ncbi:MULTISPECIES: type II toxin-antitoxin system RelE/ParE family toxin [Pseudomonas]|uniref:type II toxin-antitoxin system RelE/ParE family toxin n=1 Tax=Pseudomonas TaxID=286 RepID=UPI0004D486AB|nr:MULTISPECIES: type II toxin-antitoxin system RelE/ParE family toxin [Pseudomonas]KES20039.1 plasmid stabilization protein ParE [Pseudomonas sp. AAC]MDU4251197.1 type II toxin-antitoxin system RelE/ParE family toxin [Pseudomonas sp.]NMZ75021.1 type II toxin-antitoxin system RelE/ParE family toxin [Pseudomonas nitroreducens]OBY59523.1 plasmid stabilization protein ParE [Pseudomonas sp. AU12215]OHS15594.1 plasmid stabilization protein ParE [Pseudomonas sp. HMSC75E02]